MEHQAIQPLTVKLTEVEAQRYMGHFIAGTPIEYQGSLYRVQEISNTNADGLVMRIVPADK